MNAPVSRSPLEVILAPSNSPAVRNGAAREIAAICDCEKDIESSSAASPCTR
jgi:hypothetical protein